ncbi:hypothetical protein TSUD_57240 [Trifolium subterraneum]|uniref:Aminotransferase-like plant mobile domain-containing protein n=1 Tax=Trifolium subterraneum TaxID=3900 RepID=A0A2Z6NHH2_TRISU|nr:hypothetical protein TSUD_57240 [Trifolium subterraneum]
MKEHKWKKLVHHILEERAPLRRYVGQEIKNCTVVRSVVGELGHNLRLADHVKTGYQHLNSCLISAFVERWREETSSFHMSAEEITVTLTDVSCLLHGLLDHILVTRDEGALLMMKQLGVESADADNEVARTKEARVRMIYLKVIFKTHLQHVADYIEEGDEKCVESHQNYALRVYMLLSVSYTIFADTSKNNVHLTYLRYFEDLEFVADYAWGFIALTHLYKVEMQPNLFPFGTALSNPFIFNGDLSEGGGIDSSRVFVLLPFFLLSQGGAMDLSKVGEKILSSVKSARSLGLLPPVPDRPEVPARAAAAAAVARALAGLPPHQRYSFSSSSEELSSIYGSRPHGPIVDELEDVFYEEVELASLTLVSILY